MDHYSVLGVNRDASTDEIKSAYRVKALLLHPDKNSERDSVNNFRKLQESYQVLRDSGSRKRHDELLLHLRELSGQSKPIDSEIDLDDFTFDEHTLVYSHPCRCGGAFSVREEDLVENVNETNCDSCSLHVRILYREANDS